MAIKKRWKLDKRLVRAMEEDDLAGAKRALEAGAEVNHRFVGYAGRTTVPLVQAAATGETSMVRLLLEYGADVGATDEWGMGPHHRAAAYPETLELLLKAGADPSASTPEGYTPLHLAFNLVSAQMLIQAGAHSDALSAKSMTPVETIEMMIEGVRNRQGIKQHEIAGGEEVIAYLRALKAGEGLVSSTPTVAMTAEQEAEKAQTGRF